MDICYDDFRDIYNGNAVLLAALRESEFVVDRLTFGIVDEQELLDVCTAINGKSGPKTLEFCDVVFSGEGMLHDGGWAMMATLLLPKVRKLSLNSTHLSQEALRPILDELEKEDSVLTHLNLGLVHPNRSPPEIAQMLGVNSSLVSFHIKDDEYPRDGLVQIESVLKNQRNTTLTDLVIGTSYDDFSFAERIDPYLQRNWYMKLGRVPPQLLGAAIGRIAVSSDYTPISSASSVYWLLQKNPQIFASSFGGEGEQPCPPTKRAKLE